MTTEYREKPREQSEWLKKLNEVPACKECGVIFGSCLLQIYGKECKREKNEEA